MKKVYVIGILFLCVLLIWSSIVSCILSEEEQGAPRKQQQEQEEKETQEQEVRRVQSLINNIPLESYNTYHTLIAKAEEAEEAYNNLSEKQKQQISNYDRIEKAKTISELEERKFWAAYYLRRTIQSSLINASSYEEYSYACTIYYDTALNNPVCCYVAVRFSATNRLGGRIDSSDSAFYKTDNDGHWEKIYNPDEYEELKESGILIENGLQLYNARKELQNGVGK